MRLREVKQSYGRASFRMSASIEYEIPIQWNLSKSDLIRDHAVRNYVYKSRS